ncbi:MAG TPA: hypothetical protein VKB51_03505 [bacterium]|nr:hypothetical protein [bacterium]
MKTFSVWVLLVISIIALVPGTARAEPKNGFGLFGGFASHSLTDSNSNTFDTAGLSVGFDYQIAMASAFTLNLMLLSSGETVSNCSACTAGHGILGLGARVWAGDAFIGLHGGMYSEVRTVTATIGGVTFSSSMSGTGTGYGAIIGYESEKGVLFSVQYDAASIDFDTFSTDIAGVRIQIGYRWK